MAKVNIANIIKEKAKIISALHVSYDISDEDTKKRELKG